LIPASEKETLEGKIKEVTTWLDSNQSAEKDEFEHKQKDLEKVANPILTKMYQGEGGAPGGAGGFPGGAGGFPGGAGGFPGGAGGFPGGAGGFPGGAGGFPGAGGAGGGASKSSGPKIEEVD